ncbi:hypothetical protein FB45DRAFT_1039974 [Roridomyces roridus]|uniref:F-box domain-containing protein n=1 Tax=Roridomyces roridus TaxID=1738132 RepID=A0AAD7B2J4_9AGAR|nr:hypothetical protein FB45DRAFT_1039974 [Roridomyces roridus]
MDQSPAPPQAGTRHYILLHSNEPPDSSDIPFIQSTSSRIGARLAVLDEELARLSQLAAERAALLAYDTQNKAVLSPVRRVPNEILYEIFLRTLPSVESDGFWASAHRADNQEIAGSTPAVVILSSDSLEFLSTIREFASCGILSRHFHHRYSANSYFWSLATFDRERPTFPMSHLLTLAKSPS